MHSLAKNAVRTAAALLAMGALSGAAQAGCKINLTIANPQPIQALAVQNAKHNDTSARTKGGVWRDLRRGDWFDYLSTVSIPAGQSKHDVYEAGFSCNAQRRFRIQYRCAVGGGLHVQYYPSSNGWTKEQNVTIELDPVC